MNIKDKEAIAKEKIVPFIEKNGLCVFEVRLFFSAGKMTLRVLVDYAQGGVSLDECARLNRELSDYLDKEPLLGESFVLEVSSPGMKRGLTTLKDFLRIKNKPVSVWLKEEIGGRLHYEGRVLDVDADKDAVLLGLDSKSISVPIEIIQKAKERLT